jgi:hypothetical protein
LKNYKNAKRYKCRAPKRLKNKPSLAKFGVVTAENGPKV